MLDNEVMSAEKRLTSQLNDVFDAGGCFAFSRLFRRAMHRSNLFMVQACVGAASSMMFVICGVAGDVLSDCQHAEHDTSIHKWV